MVSLHLRCFLLPQLKARDPLTEQEILGDDVLLEPFLYFFYILQTFGHVGDFISDLSVPMSTDLRHGTDGVTNTILHFLNFERGDCLTL